MGEEANTFLLALESPLLGPTLFGREVARLRKATNKRAWALRIDQGRCEKTWVKEPRRVVIRGKEV